MLLGVMLLGACSERNREKRADETPAGSSLKHIKPGVVPFVAESRVLATITDNEKPGDNFTTHKSTAPVQPAPLYTVIFSQSGNSVAYKAMKDGRAKVVFNGKADGRSFKDIGAIVISPDGSRCAYSAIDDNNTWHVIATDRADDIVFHHVGNPVFSPDSRHIAFLASANQDWYIVVDNNVSKGSKYSFDEPLFSNDSNKIAYVENIDGNNNKLYIMDLNFNSLRIIDSVNKQLIKNNRIAAVINKKDKKQVIKVLMDRPDIVKEGPVYDAIGNLEFGSDDESLTYTAARDKTAYLVLNDKEEKFDGRLFQYPVIRPDNKAVGVVIAVKGGMAFQEKFAGDSKAHKPFDEITDLIYSRDGRQYAYLARKGKSWVVVVNGSEGPPFDKTATPKFSPDDSKVVYRARQDGRRFLVVADTNARTLRQHPVYEQVFTPTFSSDGKSVGYGVKDGNKLVWMVEKL